MPQPLILTLHLDADSQTLYQDLRQRFFPPERNVIDAHLTLFHHLPDEPATHTALAALADSTAPFSLLHPQPRSIGRGTAVFFESPPALALHRSAATLFAPHLTPQDRQGFRPHITLQNKVASEVARSTLALLTATPLPTPQASGLTLWRYLNGPWEHLTHLPFRANA